MKDALGMITEIVMDVRFRHQDFGKGFAKITVTGAAFADGNIAQQIVAATLARLTEEEADRRSKDGVE